MKTQDGTTQNSGTNNITTTNETTTSKNTSKGVATNVNISNGIAGNRNTVKNTTTGTTTSNSGNTNKAQTSNNTQNTNNQVNNTKTNNSQETNTIASQNVNLKELHLNIEGISPSFNKDTTEYYLVISNLINDIDVDASAEDASAKISITGNKDLKLGNNKIEIIVTSADGKTSKTYVINVSKTEDKNLGNSNLENLAIENVNIIPEFSSDILSYFAEVESDIESLNILAVPQNENAKAQISGNDNLQFGDNIVEVKVIAEDGITTKKYSILVHRKTQEEEDSQNKTKEILNQTKGDVQKHERKFYWWIIIIIIILIIIGIISFILWKKKKNGKEI